MSLDYSLLQPGREVSRKLVDLDLEAISAYLEAVGDESLLLSRNGDETFAPPMAIAAFSLRGILEELALPGGAVHGGQELSFDRAVPIGEPLQCSGTISQNSVRRAWRFLIVAVKANDHLGRKVMSGKATIMLPA